MGRGEESKPFKFTTLAMSQPRDLVCQPTSSGLSLGWKIPLNLNGIAVKEYKYSLKVQDKTGIVPFIKVNKTQP